MDAWKLVQDYTVPSNTTSVVLDNFGTITKDDFVKVVITKYLTGDIAMYPNNETTATNYHRQILGATASTVYAARSNTNRMLNTSTSPSIAIIYIKLSENDRYNTFSNYNESNDSNVGVNFNYTTSSGVTFPSGITSFTLVGETTNSIGTGSRIQIYKLMAEKVKDVVVSSNTTQVDLTDLNIGKDDEYLLVSDVLGTSSTGATLALTPNDLTTTSNYYGQWIFGNGSTASSGRPNVNQMTYVNAVGNNAISHTHIKLSNIGAYTHQSYQLRNAGTSNLVISNDFTSYIHQITSINKLNIVSSASNGIGAGSRFILYKLYKEPVVEPDPDTYELLAEHTVYSPTTQIDIPVNITKDDEVRLVFTFVGDSSSTSTDVSVYPNNLTTGTNYYRQTLQAFGTSAFVARQNNGICFYGRSNIKTAGFVDIKVSNNDRFVAQSQFTVYVGSESSGLGQYNANIVGTQTVSSITKLSIVGSRTNGIAAGTKIQLFKVN